MIIRSHQGRHVGGTLSTHRPMAGPGAVFTKGGSPCGEQKCDQIRAWSRALMEADRKKAVVEEGGSSQGKGPMQVSLPWPIIPGAAAGRGMMRLTVIRLLVCLLVCVRPLHAGPPQDGGNDRPAALASPGGDRQQPLAAGTGGFLLFEHAHDRAWLITAGVSRSGANLAGSADSTVSCRTARYRSHPAVSRRVNARRRLYWPIVVEAACRHGVPVELYDAVVLAESRYRVTAVSPAGAQGLAQLMPDTAEALGVTDRFDPRANLHGRARYLRQMLEAFKSPLLAVAAYNAGPGAVRRAGGLPANDETPAYVERVMNYWRSAWPGHLAGAAGQNHLSGSPEARTTLTTMGGASR